MPLSPYLARLRRQVGHELVTLPGVSACIFDEADRVLLAHHVDSGIWALPPVHADAVRWWQERSVPAPGNLAQHRVRAGRRERS
jgi:hypothetical protein